MLCYARALHGIKMLLRRYCTCLFDQSRLGNIEIEFARYSRRGNNFCCYRFVFILILGYTIFNSIFSFGGDYYFKSTHTHTHTPHHTNSCHFTFHVRDSNNLCIARYNYFKSCDCPSYHRFIIYIDSWTWNLRSRTYLNVRYIKRRRARVREIESVCSVGIRDNVKS